MSNAYNSASLLVTPNGYEAGTIFSAKPTDGSGDLSFSRASTALRRNSAGLWESVGNNVPRLNYPVGGGCPSWLFEPQATNTTPTSTLTNAAWTKDEIVVTTDSVNVISTTNSYLLAPNAVSVDTHRIYGYASFATGTNTYSVYAKASGYSWIKLRIGSNYCNFNVTTGVVGNNNGISATIQLDSNGFYKCSATFSITAGDVAYIYVASSDNAALDTAVFAGNSVNGIIFWNPQIESGSTATSPIITAGSAVTRLADVSNSTGLSAIIGQTEGSIIYEINIKEIYTSGGRGLLTLSDGSSGNRILIYIPGAGNTIDVVVQVGGVTQANISKSISAGIYRIGVGYANNSVVFYCNGTIVGSEDTSALIPACSQLNVAATESDSLTGNILVNELILYKTKLSNTELASLTS